MGFLPVVENPILNVMYIMTMIGRVSDKPILEDGDSVFPGPASLRKRARNLEKSRQKIAILRKLEFEEDLPDHKAPKWRCIGRNSFCQDQWNTR